MTVEQLGIILGELVERHGPEVMRMEVRIASEPDRDFEEIFSVSMIKPIPGVTDFKGVGIHS